MKIYLHPLKTTPMHTRNLVALLLIDNFQVWAKATDDIESLQELAIPERLARRNQTQTLEMEVKAAK